MLLAHRSCGAWIEIAIIYLLIADNRVSHRSCGAWIEIKTRGTTCVYTGSHRSCGAWIEITTRGTTCVYTGSHRSCGAWIEILRLFNHSLTIRCRIAHAVRGLKYASAQPSADVVLSHRSCGAWIEIIADPAQYPWYIVASLMRCVD